MFYKHYLVGVFYGLSNQLPDMKKLNLYCTRKDPLVIELICR